MSITVQCSSKTHIPVEVESITPCRCRELSLTEILKLPIFHGNEETEFGNLFDVVGHPGDEHWNWEGDLSGVHWLGTSMSSGSIVIEGDAGRHLGSQMSGGKIKVTGNVSDWLGGELTGGHIEVHGNAGHLVGSAYRGSPVGMTGGWIMVHGSAGNEIGHSMRRGLIAIGGDSGDLVGFNMRAGTIFVFGDSGIRHGAGMKRGTIGRFGKTGDLLPTFRMGCQYLPPMMKPIFDRLITHGFEVPKHLSGSEFNLYHGDLLEGGRGEILRPSGLMNDLP